MSLKEYLKLDQDLYDKLIREASVKEIKDLLWCLSVWKSNRKKSILKQNYIFTTALIKATIMDKYFPKPLSDYMFSWNIPK